MTVFWTDRAFEHLTGIRDHLRLTSPAYADRVVDRLIARSEQLAAFPRSGRRVPELDREDVREIQERPYRLIYRTREARLDVIAVVHGRQRLPDELV